MKKLKNKIKYGIILIGLPLIWAATCLEKNPLNHQPSSPSNSLPDTVILINGQSVNYPDPELTITFNRVVTEGRCPIGVVCCWEGLAEIEISLEDAKLTETRFPLTIYGFVGIENSARHVYVDTLGYHLGLLELEPYPVYPNEPDFSDYQATIAIYQLKE